MSQVRKFNEGGETAAPTKQESSTAKTYRLIINGREIDLDQDGLAEFRKAGSGQGGMMGNVYADIADALESGRTVRYNSDSNTISGVDFKRIDPKAIFKANENQVWDRRAQRRANCYARKNDLTHQFNSALASIGNINFVKRNENDDTTSSSSSKLSLFGSYDPFQYNIDDKGNTTFANSPLNATAKKYIDAYANLATLTREQAKEKYNFDDEKYNQFMNWYNAYGQNYNWMGEGDSLWNRIQNKNYNENDDELLALLGWNINNSSDNTSDSTNIPRSYEGSGFNNDALEQKGYYVKKNKDGNVYLYDNSGNVVQDKIYLRDTPWAKGTQWEGGAVYKGRFVTADELLNQNSEANRDFQSWVDAGYATDELGNLLSPDQIRELKDQTGWKYEGFGQQSPFSVTYNRSRQTLNGFDNIFTDPNQYYIADLTPQYNINDGTQIISFLNQSNKRDKDGVLNPYYAVSGVDQIFKTQEELQNYLNSRQITTRSGVLGQSNLNIRDYFDQDGKRYTQSNKTVKIGDKNFDIFRDQDGLYYVRGLDKKGRPNFIQLFGRNIMNKIINNQPITHDELLKGRAEEDKRSIAGKIYNWTWLGIGNDISRNTDWYDPKEYDKVLGFKKGGKIPILQYGGMFSRVNNNVKTTKASENRVGEASKAFGEQKELKTSADKWAKAAGFLDTAGAAATFIPGYGNVAGAVTGLMGSIARFASDAKRDGLDWGDARRLLTNIGLDVLTLIPGAGTAAKAAKIGKAVKSSKILNSVGKVLRNTAKPLSVAGAAGGIATAAGAVADGDGEFTSEDFAQLGQGLLGTIGGLKNIKNLNKEAKLIKEIVGDVKVGKTQSKEELAKLPWGKRQFVKAKQRITSTKNNSANNMSARWLAYQPWKQDKLLDAAIKNPKFDLKKLATDKSGKLDEQKLENIQNIIGRRLAETGKIDKNNFVLIGERINPWWFRGNQFTSSQRYLLPQGPYTPKYGKTSLAQPTSQLLVTGNNPVVTTQNNKPVIAGLLPAWKGNNIPEVNVLPSSSSPITTPFSPLIQIPQFASSYRNAQGQFLLPRGDGRFFKKTQRVWNGGPAHEIVPIQPAKYSATPKKPRFRNIGLEQAHKRKVLQEAGRQQVPAIRGLQEDIAKVRTSEDFKNLLVKINNRGSYKEIIKNNPEIKDQLRQIFIHLDPVRLGNWMTKYNLRFKKGGKIVKAQSGRKFGTFVQDNNLNDPNLFDYAKSGIISNGLDIDWTKTYGPGLFTDLRNYYLNNWDVEAFKPIMDAYIAQLSTGNNNVDLTNFTKDDFGRVTSDKNLGYGHNLWTDQLRDYLYDTGDIFEISGMNINNNKNLFVPYLNSDWTPMTMQQTYDYLIGKGVPKEQVQEYISRNAGNFANSYGTPILEEAVITASKDSDGAQVVGGQGDGSPIGKTKSRKGFNWNPDDLIGLANLGYSIHKNNQMYGLMEKSIKDAGKGLMKEMPTEIYDRYQDHITPIYQEAANQKRQFFVPTSTDVVTNYAMRQANEDAAQALLTEGRLKASEQYTNYLDRDLAARRTYADQRRQIADANRAILANTIMQLGQNNTARMLANNQSVQNYVGEMRTKLAQDRQRLKEFQLQDARVRAQNEYNAVYNKLGNKWLQEFNALDDEDKRLYGTWEGYWQDKNINDYNNAIEQASIASRNIMQDFYPGQLDYFNYRPTQLVSPTSTTRTVYYGKKGGKTPTYLKRHTGQKPDEAIWIQRNKDTAKALEKLHDAVIKLFMKALS